MAGQGGTGRTPLFVDDPDVLDAIVVGLEEGLPVSVCLETAGIRTHTFQAWMRKGKQHAVDGLHGENEECDKCGVYSCKRESPYVSLRLRVLRARANGCSDLIAEIRAKAQTEKGGSRSLIELGRALYPDKFHNPSARHNRRFTDHEVLGNDLGELRSDGEDLELAQASATIARTEAQTELAKAQKETLGKSGSYFDKLIVAVAGAVAGAVVSSDGNEMTQAELEAASPSAALDGELDK